MTSFGYNVLGFNSHIPQAGSSIAQGLTPSLWTLSGQSQTNSSQLGNSNSFNLTNIGGVDYTGNSGRIVFHYQKGSSFTGDIQVLDIGFSSTFYNINNGSNNFETSNAGNYSSYTTASFFGVGTSASGGLWVRDSNGTGSSNTGLTLTGEQYFYAETSSPAANTVGYNFWLRSPVVPLSSQFPIMSFKDGRYGAGIGTLNVHLDIQ